MNAQARHFVPPVLALAMEVFSLSVIQRANADSWVTNSPMNGPRLQHTMTILQNGKVLVVGGSGNGSDGSFTAELYDPATRRWTLTRPLNAARASHTATLLSHGKVRVT